VGCRRQLLQSQAIDRLWEPPKRNLHKLTFPPRYPTHRAPFLESPEGMHKLDAESLFYAFYYQGGTAQQKMAAKELKNLSWRFHKNHRAWFLVGPPPPPLGS
jgi:CCR4-NOT transcription complex subunit 3